LLTNKHNDDLDLADYALMTFAAIIALPAMLILLVKHGISATIRKSRMDQGSTEHDGIMDR
jgi:hypothetical protein